MKPEKSKEMNLYNQKKRNNDRLLETNELEKRKITSEIKLSKEQENVELTFPHEQIKNTSMCEIIVTENRLDTGRKTLIQSKL